MESSNEVSNQPTLNLLVIRSVDLDRAATFYETLGLSFAQESHGRGPVHYVSVTDGLVFEIYPLQDDGASTTETRLGFQVDNVSDAVAALKDIDAEIVSVPRSSQWGIRAVVKDFDGHIVELLTPA